MSIVLLSMKIIKLSNEDMFFRNVTIGRIMYVDAERADDGLSDHLLA